MKFQTKHYKAIMSSVLLVLTAVLFITSLIGTINYLSVNYQIEINSFLVGNIIPLVLSLVSGLLAGLSYKYINNTNKARYKQFIVFSLSVVLLIQFTSVLTTIINYLSTQYNFDSFRLPWLIFVVLILVGIILISVYRGKNYKKSHVALPIGITFLVASQFYGTITLFPLGFFQIMVTIVLLLLLSLYLYEDAVRRL